MATKIQAAAAVPPVNSKVKIVVPSQDPIRFVVSCDKPYFVAGKIYLQDSQQDYQLIWEHSVDTSASGQNQVGLPFTSQELKDDVVSWGLGASRYDTAAALTFDIEIFLFQGSSKIHSGIEKADFMAGQAAWVMSSVFAIQLI